MKPLIDITALRTWGMAASAAFIAGATALSLGAPPAAPAPAFLEEATPLAFAVRFRGAGPLARAQALAARDPAYARAVAERELARQRDFAGLCFDRLVSGGAEMVLRTCTPTALDRRHAAAEHWLAKLRVVPGVEYVSLAAASPGQEEP